MRRWTAPAAGRKRLDPVRSIVLTLRRVRPLRLLPLGASFRLLGASLIVAGLWGAFLWATATPGGAP